MTVTTGVSDYLGRVARQFDEFVRDEAVHIGELVTKEVADRTPIGQRVDRETGVPLGPDGRARRSWKPIVPFHTADGWQTGTSSDVSYIPELEGGARRHFENGSLRFFTHGELAYARRVNHPGMLGKHMQERGLREAERIYAEEAASRLQKFLDGRDRP